MSKIREALTRAWSGRSMVAALALFAGATFANPIATIGTAADFAVLGLRDGVSILNAGTTTGSVGLSHLGELKLTSGGIITGGIAFADAISATNCAAVTCGVHNPGPVQDAARVASAANAAMAASTAIKGASATQTITGNLDPTGITTFASTGANNVIRITGNVTLDGSDILRLSGGADDYFYFDIGGGLDMSGAALIELSGISASHVIFNILGGGTALKVSSGSIGKGYFIAPDGKVDIGGIVEGGVFGGLDQIKIATGSVLIGLAGAAGGGSGVAGVPEPSSLVLALAALLPLGALWRRRTAAVAAA